MTGRSLWLPSPTSRTLHLLSMTVQLWVPAQRLWAAGPCSVKSTIPSPVVLADHPNTFFSISLRVATSHSVFSIQSGPTQSHLAALKRLQTFQMCYHVMESHQIIQKELEPARSCREKASPARNNWSLSTRQVYVGA